MTVIYREEDYVIEPASLADADGFANVLVAAFLPNAVNHLMLPDTTTWHQHFLDALKDVWEHPKAHALKAVDRSSRKIIGGAVWASFDGDELHPSAFGPLAHGLPLLSNRQQEETSSSKPNLSPSQKLEKQIAYEVRQAQRRWIVGKPCQYLAIVGVHPDRQGHGVGESLVQVGMNKANERQVACYLEATPAGFPVYKKLGWNQADKGIDIDLSEFAGEYSGYGVYRFRCMLKLPDMKGSTMMRHDL